jgi:hypothetical protein
MKSRFFQYAIWVGCLSVFSCQAGTIVIEPAPQGSRSKLSAEKSAEKARQRTRGITQKETIIITDAPVEARMTDQINQAEQSGREAQEYLDPPSLGGGVDENTTVILYSVPLSSAEKARQKARSYVASSTQSKTCTTSAENDVGMIGDGGNSENVSASSKGGSTVVMRCK